MDGSELSLSLLESGEKHWHLVNAVESQTQSHRFMTGGSLDKSSRSNDEYFEPDEDELEEER